MITPQRSIQDHPYDWMFHLALFITILASIINIYIILNSKYKEKKNLFVDISIVISALLILLYHFLYRWQLFLVVIFVILVFIRTIERTIIHLNIKNIF